MPTVRFLREGIEVEVEEGANLRNVAQEVGVEVYSKPWSYGLNCKGFGHCGTCRVSIKNDTMDGASDLSWMEVLQFKLGWPLSPIPFINTFAYIGKEDEMRLSCQVTVEGDMDVLTRPGVNYTGDEDWQYKGSNPAISGKSIEPSPEQTTFEKSEMDELSE
ncbi:MAG: ferredoxin [bacterium]